MRGEKREIQIIGGGLAGLSLGIALLKRDVAVQLYDAGGYPRHRVCGEFIAGLRPETASALGIEEDLSDAEQHRGVTWFRGTEKFRRDSLPTPALGISRHKLDQRLAERFEACGGVLRSNSRFTAPPDSQQEGLVWANGRERARSDWMGIKMHCRDLKLSDDLEVHLGDQAYAGASGVEDGRVNVCALMRRRPNMLSGPRENAFFDCLESAGLNELASRVRQGDPDIGSQSSVAGLAFGAVAEDGSEHLRIGDAHSLIPPFTGDGMAMAFEGAHCVLQPIIGYVSGSQTWVETTAAARKALGRQFKHRLAIAGGIHPFLYNRRQQAVFRAASSTRLLPFSPLFHLLH